ncbi:NAD-dependent epimerase [Mariniflexile ostreae]|uniref:NAD-dependent epimerase n=1 Tax=Mariniflexile ostreae TaxID=1520892 RepID=A0ABV5F731_9FLAO
MRILITGAAGFIGFHLVEKLIKSGLYIVGIDNINNYYDVNLKYDRLNQVGLSKDNISNDGELVASSIFPNFSFAKIDLVDLKKLETLFKQEKFTHVVNLAAQAGVRYSLENPHAYVQSNLIGFVNILECCRGHRIKHLIYASSSSVYGSNLKIPFSEEDKVDTPVSLYAATKKSNELMAYAYSHLYHLPTTGLRFFTVYGPWGRPDMAPMLFANAIMKGEPIKVFNNGEMQRDFTYIDDIIDGVIKVMDTIPNKTPKADVFNIGNSKPVDLMKFILLLEKSLGKEAIKSFYPMQDGDVKVTYADTGHLNKRTGYKPNISLENGISRFTSWFLERESDN